jgi:phosphoribosylanthranilate isomerase
MDPVAGPRIKICCMQGLEELALAVRYGADAVGLVSAMPSGPGPIDDELIAIIAARVPPGVSSFLLTSRRAAAGIADQVRRLRPTAVQIVDRPEDGCHAALRAALPGLKIVQVVHVTGPEALAEARAAAPAVDALLLDSGNPALPVKELGGTGRTHDWATSRRIREAVSVPVWLAGGLTPGNVASAIEAVRPFGVDVCSGVRTHGRLDEDMLARFVAAVRAGGSEVS